MPPKLSKDRQIVADDDEKDVLGDLQEELEDDDLKSAQAFSYEKVISRITSLTYDLVILGIVAVRGFELLGHASSKNIPVVMHIAHSSSATSLRQPTEFGARDCLPKDRLAKAALS